MQGSTSLKENSVCVVDATGKLVREVKVLISASLFGGLRSRFFELSDRG